MPWSRILIALRGILYAPSFVLLWGWLAVSVRPLDARLPVHIPPSLRLAWVEVLAKCRV